MARPYISPALREQIAVDANYQCGYCHTPQSFTAMPMHIDHIIPIAAGGSSERQNLWLACPLCNSHKGVQTEASDPETDTLVALFNPRQQNWEHHFRWSADGTNIIGISSIGRATVLALKLNNEHFLRARRRWALAGWHPPPR